MPKHGDFPPHQFALVNPIIDIITTCLCIHWAIIIIVRVHYYGRQYCQAMALYPYRVPRLPFQSSCSPKTWAIIKHECGIPLNTSLFLSSPCFSPAKTKPMLSTSCNIYAGNITQSFPLFTYQLSILPCIECGMQTNRTLLPNDLFA